MATQELMRDIVCEMEDIESEYDVGSWDYTEVDRMDPDEAYNRGYYRALQSTKKSLEDENAT